MQQSHSLRMACCAGGSTLTAEIREFSDLGEKVDIFKWRQERLRLIFTNHGEIRPN